MRAVFLVPCYPVETETFISAQVEALRNRGWVVNVLPEMDSLPGAPAGSRLARAADTLRALIGGAASSPGVTLRAVDPVRHGRKALDGSLLRDAAALDAGPRPDIVHAHFGESGLRAVALRRIGAFDAPLVTTFYGHDVSSLVRHQGPDLYRPLADDGDRFLALGPTMRDRLTALGFDDTKIVEHPLMVDCGVFRPGAEPRCSSRLPLRIATIARMVPKKGIADALEVVARVRDQHTPVRHVLAGDGPQRPLLEARASELGLEDVVTFVGMLPHREVASLLKATDVLLAPSRQADDGDEEGTPAVILEAMASGVPVVATRHAGIPDIVQGGVTGLLADEGDLDRLTELTRGLAGDPGLRNSLGQAGRARALSRHDVECVTDRLLTIYADAAHTGGLP